jgi:hypothetical protein
MQEGNFLLVRFVEGKNYPVLSCIIYQDEIRDAKNLFFFLF